MRREFFGILKAFKTNFYYTEIFYFKDVTDETIKYACPSFFEML